VIHGYISLSGLNSFLIVQNFPNSAHPTQGQLPVAVLALLYSNMQLLPDHSPSSTASVVVFRPKNSFLSQNLRKRFLWHKSILYNHNSGLTLQNTHENIHALQAFFIGYKYKTTYFHTENTVRNIPKPPDCADAFF